MTLGRPERGMEALFERAGAWTDDECASTWHSWLWGSDCNALPMEQCCDMSRMHGWGVLCCIREANAPGPMYQQSLVEILPELPAVHLHGDTAIYQFSLRELMDQIECMQLNWGQIVGELITDEPDEPDRKGAERLLRAIMARVGFIATHAFETSNAENGYEGFVLDDPQHTSVLPNSHNMSIISRKSLRQVICVLLGLARVQDIVQRSVHVPVQSPEKQARTVLDALKQHHIEASMDFFNCLQQMTQLAPGMRLAYRTNFSGMYNDVSQVIYFHFPKFARQPQLSLRDIPGHMTNLLPLIRELLPDVPVIFDDDSQIPNLTTVNSNNNNSEWVWLVSCGSVFLVEPNTIHRSDSLVELVCYLLERTGRQLIVQGDEDGAQRRRRVIATDGSFTEHGHVEMLQEDDADSV